MPASDLQSSHPASARVLDQLCNQFTFQISVDTDNLRQGLVGAEAARAAGITLLEMGTPLLKFEGVLNVVPAFRKRFPEALILADMKTMDGGAGEATKVYEGGANIIDFLATAGVDTARNICAVRDGFRRRDAEIPRLAFADMLIPHQGPAEHAVEIAHAMLDAGVDGVGVHLQSDARRADPSLFESGYIADIARAVFNAVGDRGSVQVVGGLSIQQATALAKDGLRAFVISANLGLHDSDVRYGLPPGEMEALIAKFIAEVSAA